MEVGPWRWDGKSEHDFWVRPGGWEEYTTMVYGMSFQIVTLSRDSDLAFSGPTTWYWLLLHKIRRVRPYRRCGVLLPLQSHGLLDNEHLVQAQAYILEFIKNFYQVFPEYQTVDVSWSYLLYIYILHEFWPFLPDVSCWGKLCWPMDTIPWYARRLFFFGSNF